MSDLKQGPQSRVYPKYTILVPGSHAWPLQSQPSIAHHLVGLTINSAVNVLDMSLFLVY